MNASTDSLSPSIKDLEMPLVQSSESEPKKQDNPVSSSGKFKDLFQFATRRDVFLMTVGGLAAFANGWALPLFSMIFGGMTNDITTHFNDLMYVGRKYAS